MRVFNTRQSFGVYQNRPPFLSNPVCHECDTVIPFCLTAALAFLQRSKRLAERAIS